MALTIEDGSIVDGADSWATVAELDAYAAAYGHTITAADDAAKEVLLRKAQRAISTRWALAGDLVSQSQTTALPRYWGRAIKGYSIGPSTIPQDFKDAQCEMALAIDQGADPFAMRTAENSKRGAQTMSRAKAGPVDTETEYSDIGSVGIYDETSTANYTAVNAILRPYMAAGFGQLPLYRG